MNFKTFIDIMRNNIDTKISISNIFEFQNKNDTPNDINGDSIEVYIKNIFRLVIPIHNWDEYLNNRDLDTYKKWYIRNYIPKNFAKSVYNSMETKDEQINDSPFVCYIDNLNDAQKEKIIIELKNRKPTEFSCINEQSSFNLGNILYRLLTSVLNECANKPRNNNSLKKEINNSTKHFIDLYLEYIKEFCRNSHSFLDYKAKDFYDYFICNDICEKPLFQYFSKEYINDNKITNFNIADLIDINENNCILSKDIILEGVAGIGKTTLFKHICLNIIKKSKKIIPIYLELKYFTFSHKNFLDFIYHSFSTVTLIDKDIFQEIIKNNQIILLLDGFDELPINTDNFITMLKNFKQKFKIPIIISSRPNDKIFRLSNFTKYEVLPLNKEQIIEIVKKTYCNQKILENSFINNLNENYLVLFYDIVSNPMLLKMFLNLYSQNKDIPKEKHLIYEYMFRHLVYKRNMTDNEINTIKIVLCEFCFLTLFEKIQSFSKDTFLIYMNKITNNNDHSLIIFEKLINECGLLYENNNNYYFIHKTFQEYFAALYIASKEFNSQTLKNIFNSQNDIIYSLELITFIYELNKPKLEHHVIYPFLKSIFNSEDKDEEFTYYEIFLMKLYPEFICCEFSEKIILYPYYSLPILYEFILLIFNYSKWIDVHKWFTPNLINDFAVMGPYYIEEVENSETFIEINDLYTYESGLLEDEEEELISFYNTVENYQNIDKIHRNEWKNAVFHRFITKYIITEKYFKDLFYIFCDKKFPLHLIFNDIYTYYSKLQNKYAID